MGGGRRARLHFDFCGGYWQVQVIGVDEQRAKIKIYETRTNPCVIGIYCCFPPSALSAVAAVYHAVANGCDAPDRGKDGGHFG